MPRATGNSVAEICEKTLAELEAEADFALDRFVGAAEMGRHFGATIEKIEGQLATARKLEAAERDFELNEAQVIAEKLEGEVSHAEKLALGAALLESEEEWASEFEGMKDSFEMMHAYMKKIKASGRAAQAEGAALEARNSLLSFRRKAAACRETIAQLKARLSARNHPAYSKLESVKKGLRSVRAGVGKAFSKISRGRLRKKIAEAKAQIGEFFSHSYSGKLFVDHKHLTLQSGAHKVHLPLTQAMRFALEEIAPIGGPLSKLGRRGTMVTATYEKGEKGSTLRVGERCVMGDAIIYREKSYRVDFGTS